MLHLFFAKFSDMLKQYIRLIIPVLLTFSTYHATAQSASDALRYSSFNTLGTARSMGVGGSMSAIGADFAMLSLNPAGLGAYRYSEFMISPAVFSNQTSSRLENGTSSAQKESINQFLLANIGFVFGSRPVGTKWRTSNFAIGVNKIDDYHQQFRFRGSSAGSITDRFAELAQGLTPDDLGGFEDGLAYSSGAIYDFDEDLIYETDYQLVSGEFLDRSQVVDARGFNSEIIFSYGANYNEKLLFGITLGIPILSYDEEKVYIEEDDAADDIPFFNQLRYEEFLSTSGNGFNLKVGMIYKITNAVSIGAAWHSRTRYTLTDNFSSIFEYDYTDTNGNSLLSNTSPNGSFDYDLRTPSTWIGSIGAVILRSGFISAEVQYTDFSEAEFDFTGGSNGNTFLQEEQAVNADIDNQLGAALKLKFGGEFRLNPVRLRAGVVLQQSPFGDTDRFDETLHAGIGFRAKQERLFIDLGYQYFTEDQGYIPYTVEQSIQPFVVNEVRNNRFVLTIGYKWE